MQGFDQLYPALVKRAWEHGAHRTARGKAHRALFNVVIDTQAVENLPIGNGFSKKFAIAELMAYAAGWDDVAWLARFNKNIAQFSDDGVSFRGAYGPRMAWSLGALCTLLNEDPETRQAICQIYQADDLTTESKDKPCNTMFQLQSSKTVNGTVELHMTIYQRSCDLVWGLPYDHFSFSTLLILFAYQLRMQPGRVTRVIANAHVYEPEAGFANEGRLARAMQPIETMFWEPPSGGLFAFRETCQIARYQIEGKHDPLTEEEFTADARFLVEILK